MTMPGRASKRALMRALLIWAGCGASLGLILESFVTYVPREDPGLDLSMILMPLLFAAYFASIGMALGCIVQLLVETVQEWT